MSQDRRQDENSRIQMEQSKIHLQRSIIRSRKLPVQFWPCAPFRQLDGKQTVSLFQDWGPPSNRS